MNNYWAITIEFFFWLMKDWWLMMIDLYTSVPIKAKKYTIPSPSSSLPVYDVFVLAFAALLSFPVGEMQIVIDECITEETVL